MKHLQVVAVCRSYRTPGPASTWMVIVCGQVNHIGTPRSTLPFIRLMYKYVQQGTIIMH